MFGFCISQRISQMTGARRISTCPPRKVTNRLNKRAPGISLYTNTLSPVINASAIESPGILKEAKKKTCRHESNDTRDTEIVHSVNEYFYE
jgi:hypothetical protein